MDFRDKFDTRELAELDFARHYAAKPHGTDGHHRLMLISKLYDIALELSKQLQEYEDNDGWPTKDIYHDPSKD
jgi:hypothetical protein